MSAAAYELGVGRDPGSWLAKWRDRGNVVPDSYVDRVVAMTEAQPVAGFEIHNPYERRNEDEKP